MDESMNLPEGKKCSDCGHCRRCTTIYGKTEHDTTCDFYPVKFREKEEK